MSWAGGGFCSPRDYGWIKSRRSSSGGGFLYDYGWPLGGTTESNVVAQWAFQEKSGDLVDEVASITVPDATAGIVYDVSSGTNDWPGNGIQLPSNEYFYTTSDIGITIPNAGDFVIECVLSTVDVFSNILLGFNNYRFCFSLRGLGTNTADLTFYDGTNAASGQLPVPVGAFTGYHKYRFAGTVGTSVELFFDGALCGSLSLAPITGAITGENGMGFGVIAGVGTTSGMIMREFRVTNGNKTNNSGGPGGG